MIPQELRDLPQWVVAGKNKIPLNPRTLRNASVTDSRTWGTYEQASNLASQHGLYVGFVFTKDDPYTGIDLDNPTDDIEAARHKQILKDIVSYTEVSASGNGIHIIVRGAIPHAAKRHHVEVYDTERYFIMTGKIVKGRPKEIRDCTDKVIKLVEELSGDKAKPKLDTYHAPAREDDSAVLQRCQNSANGAAFARLWSGGTDGYTSQSEADFALVNMLAFVSPSDEQVARLFQSSGLGQRKKAYRADYMSSMLETIRAEQFPPIDFSQFKPPALSTVSKPQFVPSPTNQPLDAQFPDGLVGELAQYIYDTAIRPVPEVALMGALGLMAGITGRCYNINHTGLNLYLMLVAGTGIGKEGAAQGVRRVVQAVARKLPAIQQYLGPTEFASGQALIKQLDKFPCQLCVFSEFGYTLKRICRPEASSADVMQRKILLDIYNKSGAGDVLGEMVYSDAGKNTPIVQSPALTLLTESSPAALYEGLDEQAIETGLVPRFILMECPNQRPPSNPQAFAPPPAALVSRLEALAHRCLSMGANNTRVDVLLAPQAHALIAPRQAFDLEVDAHINAHNEDAIRQIWNRAHLKALKLAALVALGHQHDAPVVQLQAAEWAVNLVRLDAQHMLRRFAEGVGMGDPVQLAQLRSIIENVLTAPNAVSSKMREYRVVTHRQLSQRAYALACYRNDRRGAGDALKRALQALMDCGELMAISPSDARQHFGTTAKCYLATEHFNR